eukprot:4417375-Pyramimonas_sp.AAC.1
MKATSPASSPTLHAGRSGGTTPPTENEVPVVARGSAGFWFPASTGPTVPDTASLGAKCGM